MFCLIKSNLVHICAHLRELAACTCHSNTHTAVYNSNDSCGLPVTQQPLVAPALGMQHASVTSYWSTHFFACSSTDLHIHRHRICTPCATYPLLPVMGQDILQEISCSCSTTQAGGFLHMQSRSLEGPPWKWSRLSNVALQLHVHKHVCIRTDMECHELMITASISM